MRKEKGKNKAKERKKRANRKYGQAKLKHSKKGIQSCVIAGIVHRRTGTCHSYSYSDWVRACSERAERTREKLSYM